MIKNLIIEYIRQNKYFRTIAISMESMRPNKGDVMWDLFCNNKQLSLNLDTKINKVRLYTFNKVKDNSAIRVKRNTSYILISVMFYDYKNNIYGYKLRHINKMINNLRVTYYDYRYR